MQKIDGNIIFIPDKKIKNYLVTHVDKNGTGEISEQDALNVTQMNCSGKEIYSLEGIQFF